MEATTVADRYASAHLAALRAAAAVLAARARPVRGRRGSAWELISKVAPEFAEWAAFFAAGSAKRQAAEAGIHRLVSAREADDMVRQVAVFLGLVEEALTTGSWTGPRRDNGNNQTQRRAL
ncbi:MAG: SAV_6107 family HEPN domain-containing protein [Nakamurella sp.]